jgi:hypothetical protein
LCCAKRNLGKSSRREEAAGRYAIRRHPQDEDQRLPPSSVHMDDWRRMWLDEKSTCSVNIFSASLSSKIYEWTNKLWIFMCSEKSQGGGGYEVWTEKPVRYLNVYVFIYTSGYPWPSDTVKSLDFFKPRETHTKAQNSFFNLFIVFEKSPMKTYMEGMSDIYKSPILI